MSELQLSLEGETVVVARRRFAASPDRVFQAHMDPELIRQWMLGPDGWTMPVCINEAKPGGQIRYEWAGPDGAGFHLTGEILELDPPHRSVHVERMHLPMASMGCAAGPQAEQAPSTGETMTTPDNRIETTFTADGDGTLMVMRMNLPDAASRAAMLATGMEHGMEASYVRLEQLARA